MSEARAIAKYIRLSPRKVRQVMDLIRGKKIGEALAILKFTPRRAAAAIEKVVKSAVANAEHNQELDKDALFIAEAFVDQGPTLKRTMPRAMGRADLMRRRTSHITVVVREEEAAIIERKAAEKAAGGKKKTVKKAAVKEKVEAAPEKKKTVRKKKEAAPETKEVLNENQETVNQNEEAAPEIKKVTRKKKEG
ncbi:MAG: 50S ribosomal protein L22 [Firmicutes bacterium HGW-Firmicutes-8]|nr:MAG: 50S ribosomal protein L22 [Firmicutes bacterium HGW-Firmicutes-8]